MNALGIARLTELQQMDATIVTLGLRKAALEAEERALRNILGVSSSGTGTGTGNVGRVVNVGTPVGPPVGRLTGLGVGNPPSGFSAIESSFPYFTRADGVPIGASTKFAYLKHSDGSLVIDSPENVNDFLNKVRTLGVLIGAYEHGTDYVPHTGPAMLHAGEAVLTAEENRARRNNSGTGITLRIGEVNISGANGAQSGRDAAEAFVRKLETDGALAARLAKAVKERQH